jgi:hypothetical protein
LPSHAESYLPFLEFDLQGFNLTALCSDESILLFHLNHHQVLQALQALHEDGVQLFRTHALPYRRHRSKRLPDYTGQLLDIYLLTAGDCSYLSTSCDPWLLAQIDDGSIVTVEMSYGWAL